MAAYKKQHFLPAAYLRYFSCDQSKCTRKSLIWRIDKNGKREVPIESQCREDYFYSELRAAEAEVMFCKSEVEYCKIIDTIKAGQELSGQQLGNLFLTALDFNLRNAKYKNHSRMENIDAYFTRAWSLFSRVLTLKRNGTGTVINEILNYCRDNWRLHLLHSCSVHRLVTSDHPSMLISLNALNPTLHLVILPLTPNIVAIGYDRRIVEMVNTTFNAHDAAMLNMGVTQNADKCIFASWQITDAEETLIQSQFQKQDRLEHEATDSYWKPSMMKLPPEKIFSFMRLICLPL